MLILKPYQSHGSAVRVFGDQVCDPGHDTERRHVAPFFHTVWSSTRCIELMIQFWTGSFGSREARHHGERIRPRGCGDTPSSVIVSFISEHLRIQVPYMFGAQSTHSMTTWSHSPAHVLDATGLVPVIYQFCQIPNLRVLVIGL